VRPRTKDKFELPTPTELQIWDLSSGKRLRTGPARFGVGYHLTFSPDGKVLVAAGEDEHVGVQAWTTDRYRPLSVADMPPCRFRSVAFGPDGRMTGCGVRGHTVVLWDLRSGKLLGPVGGHQSPVMAMSFSADGQRLLSVGLGCTLREWSLQGAELRRLPFDPPDLFHFTFFARRFAFSRGGAYLSLSNDSNDARVYDARTRKLLLSCEKRGGRDSEPAFSPDGEVFAVDGYSESGKHGEVKLWKVSTGKEVAVLKVAPILLAHGLAVSPNGKSVAVAGRMERGPNGRSKVELRLWQTDTGRESPAFKPRALPDRYRPVPLAFSRDGRFLVMADRQGAFVLDATTGAEVWRLTLPEREVSAFLCSPDGRSLAVATSAKEWHLAEQQATVTLWELSSGQMRWQSSSVDARIWALAFAPDSKTLAAGHADGTVLLWDVAGRLRGGKALAPAELERRWAELGALDAGAAFAALRALAATPKQAVALVQQRVPPATGKSMPPAVVARLIGELADENFVVRARAHQALAEQGSAVEAALRKALADKPELEARRRLEQLLARLEGKGPPPELRRPLRAVEVLEWVGTAEARQALGRLAKGHPSSALTREAQQALGRLTTGGR
jgi:WD40 repeat protein